MSQNKHRAEKSLQINNKPYTAKVVLDTIMRIEDSLGGSIFEIASKFQIPSVRINEVIIIIYQAVRSGGHDITEKDIKSYVAEVGVVEATKTAGELVVLGLNVEYGGDQKKSEA
jgi:hypothetical protein